MTNPIGPLSPLQPLQMGSPVGKMGSAVGESGQADFQKMLLNSIAETNSMEMQANAAVEQSLAGGDITQVEVLSAIKKADLAMRMMMQFRNKTLDAFNEIKQMQM